jgi:transmembrane sensor
MSREAIAEEAATWVVRLSESSDEALRADCRTWRKANIQNNLAFQKALAAWERMDRAVALRADQGVLNADLLAPAVNRTVKPANRNRWMAIAASIVLVLGGTATVGLSLSASQAYATGVGERRLIALKDGSTIELNTDSKVVVSYGANTRSVRLVKGEAVFHVAKERRPFNLKTGAVRVDAQQADLTVRLIDSDARITVLEGLATAERTDGPAPAGTATTIQPGAEALIGRDGAEVHTVSMGEVNQLLAWRQGGIALNGLSLADAVAEFNRYNIRKIEIADTNTGALHVGGYYRTSDMDGFVNSVAEAFALKVSKTANGDIELASKSKATSL